MKNGLKILVPYDGSSESNNAIKEALDIAKTFNASITLLHVYCAHAERKYKRIIKNTENIDVRDEVSLRIFSHKKELLDKSGVVYYLRSEKEANIPKTIVEIAKDERFGLIVMGTRGLGRAKSWLLGSVSQKVIAEAECPVLTTK